MEATTAAVEERFLPMYRASDHGKVMADIARYGLEHRNMMSLTPLMMAGYAGNVELVEALIDLGARIDAVDTFGRMPFHFALRSAFKDEQFAKEKLGALYDLLCPTGLDLEVDGRLVRLGRNQGEFFVLAALLALFHGVYGQAGFRSKGFTVTVLDEKILATLPRSVLPDERRRRVYWNGVFARAEVDAAYRPARRLWRRESHGHYLPSELAFLRTVDENGTETKRSLFELLRVPLLEEHAKVALSFASSSPRRIAR